MVEERKLKADSRFSRSMRTCLIVSIGRVRLGRVVGAGRRRMNFGLDDIYWLERRGGGGRRGLIYSE